MLTLSHNLDGTILSSLLILHTGDLYISRLKNQGGIKKMWSGKIKQRNFGGLDNYTFAAAIKIPGGQHLCLAWEDNTQT